MSKHNTTEMTATQANEWVGNLVSTVNSVIAAKGWDHNEATVNQVTNLVVGEIAQRAADGDSQAERVLTMTLTALALQA